MSMLRHSLLFFVLLTVSLAAQGQCTMTNTAIARSEIISYNLYFNWQFIWVKVGTAAMTTTTTTYEGQEAFRTSLITRSNGTADKYFILRDTLMSYCTTALAPLYYRKGAQEGKHYTVDEAWYDYPDGGQQVVRLHRQKNSGTHVYDSKTFSDCVVDMLHLFQRGRSFPLHTWQKGYEMKVSVTDGVKILPAYLRCNGRETVKGDDGNKYECIKLTYVEVVDGKEKTIACFFVSDDDRHIPIRLDLFLRFGSAKAFLTHKQITE